MTTSKTWALRDIENLEVPKDLDSLGLAVSPHGHTDPVVRRMLARDHHQADFAVAKTSVWWDIENCEVPKGCDAYGIAQKIRSVLLKSNYYGSLIINAYGDTNKIPSYVQQALSSTGVSLNHVPAGVKDGSDKKILVDMMLWAMENRAPANIMLISGDRDFSYALHQLGMKRYNILLARPEKASEPLIAAAKTVWLWTSIVTEDRPKRPIDNGLDHRPKRPIDNGLDHRPKRPIDNGLDHRPKRPIEVLSHLVPKPSRRMDSGLVSGRKRCRSYCELCNVVCSNHDLTIHLSGRRHRAKAIQVAHERPIVSSLTEPKSVWCGVCRMSFQSEARYENHILGSVHQNRLDDQAGRYRKRVCRTP